MSLSTFLEQPTHRAAVALCVGASDGSGQAGVQVDLRTLAVVGVRPATVLTATRPFAVFDDSLVAGQLRATLAAHPIDAAKLGDLGSPTNVAALAERLQDAEVGPIVLDAELVDARGEPRGVASMAAAVFERLAPLAEVWVVNSAEAERLTGRPAPDLGALREAGKRLWDSGARRVLLTGGRLEGHAVDLLYDGRDFVELGADRVKRADLRGQGAVLSASLTGHLARGAGLLEAAQASKALVSAALHGAVRVGSRLLAEPAAPALGALGVDPEPIDIKSTSP